MINATQGNLQITQQSNKPPVFKLLKDATMYRAYMFQHNCMCRARTDSGHTLDKLWADSEHTLDTRVSHENIFWMKKLAQPALQVFGGCFEGI